jgi:hypothetical protein
MPMAVHINVEFFPSALCYEPVVYKFGAEGRVTRGMLSISVHGLEKAVRKCDTFTHLGKVIA